MSIINHPMCNPKESWNAEDFFLEISLCTLNILTPIIRSKCYDLLFKKSGLSNQPGMNSRWIHENRIMS